MQLRISRVARNGKTYEYAQLVESVRRPSDGTPTHRVVASLGALSPEEIANLRTAIAANREGRRVILARPPRRAAALPKIVANLRYLDVAVLLEAWNQWHLPELLAEVMPAGEADVSPAAVVASLVIQRCVAPGSKLYATQWFPRSALPELLGVALVNFNNTRVHRVLDELEVAGPALMAKLPRRYMERDGAFAVLFLDVTDTWFFGAGPELSAVGKTKEGFLRRKVGIVLLCNEHGYPLRWEVVSGTSPDSKTMTRMVEVISKLAWVGEAPVVCDRAMGKTAQIRTLATSGLRFLTALTTTEFGSYAELPDPGSGVEADAAVQAAVTAGMEKVEDNLYVMDMGTVERAEEGHTEPAASASSPRRAMQLGRQIRDWVSSGQHKAQAAAARALGIGKQVAKKYYALCKLDDDIQRDLLDGLADGCSLAALRKIADLPVDEQQVAFAALRGSPERQPADTALQASEKPVASFTVRVLGYFNPERFVDQRQRAQRHLEKIKAFIAELNASLASGRSRRTRESVAAAVDRCLREHELINAFALSIDEEKVADRIRFHVRLELNEAEWARRRRYDGFTLLVGHPGLTGTAAELCRLYRAKDAVEKDFQVIKSVVELRPMHHRTDAKVRAHVTLCMLALLLEKTLQRQLKGTHSAVAALETLGTCHLNRFAAAGDALYSLTEPTDTQRGILRTLGMSQVVNDDVLEGLAPR